MQKIVPQLWFDTQAKEAVEFYVSAFPNSKIISHAVLNNTPGGTADYFTFSLSGFEMGAISSGPLFKANPSVSFMVNFDPSRDPQAREHLDELWLTLAEDGMVLMPLQEYPFSKRYGWIQDKFGVSWQLILTNPAGEPRPFIVPSLLFTQGVSGRAEEALKFYASVFPHSTLGTLARFPTDTEFQKTGMLMFGEVALSGEWLVAMDGGTPHAFTFSEGISLLVRCKDQAEIDAYTDKLSAVPGAEQCGWLKDQFGFSWQIAPESMDEIMGSGDQAKIDRVVQALIPMKRLDLKKLEEAAND